LSFFDLKPKSKTRKRSVSNNISIKFRLDQRLYDKPSSLSMLDIMQEIAKFISCNLLSFKILKKNTKILSITRTTLDKLKIILGYFNKYTLLGIKSKNFKD
jgi:hypothetical protein